MNFVHTYNRGLDLFAHTILIFVALFWWQLRSYYVKTSLSSLPLSTLATSSEGVPRLLGDEDCIKEKDSIKTVVELDKIFPSSRVQRVVTTKIKGHGSFKNEKRVIILTSTVVNSESPISVQVQKNQSSSKNTFDYMYEFNEKTCSWDPYEILFKTEN